MASESGEKRYVFIKLRQRSWVEWMGWLFWLVALGLFLEYAITSGLELERQAAVTSWLGFGVLLAGGLTVAWMMRTDYEAEWDELMEMDEADD